MALHKISVRIVKKKKFRITQAQCTFVYLTMYVQRATLPGES